MKLEDVGKLHQKKFRDALGHFLVEGEHLVLELQKAARQQPARMPDSTMPRLERSASIMRMRPATSGNSPRTSASLSAWWCRSTSQTWASAQ